MEIKKSGSARNLESGKIERIAVAQIRLVPGEKLQGATKNNEMKDKLIEAFSQPIRVRVLGQATNTLSNEVMAPLSYLNIE